MRRARGRTGRQERLAGSNVSDWPKARPSCSGRGSQEERPSPGAADSNLCTAHPCLTLLCSAAVVGFIVL